jgi:hypothetical protein
MDPLSSFPIQHYCEAVLVSKGLLLGSVSYYLSLLLLFYALAMADNGSRMTSPGSHQSADPRIVDIGHSAMAECASEPLMPWRSVK